MSALSLLSCVSCVPWSSAAPTAVFLSHQSCAFRAPTACPTAREPCLSLATTPTIMSLPWSDLRVSTLHYPAPVSISHYSHGSYQRWVPPQASGQVQHSRAGGAAPSSSLVPEQVPKEPQGFQRYQTRMGPRAPSPVPQRRSRRARPSKRARTSGPRESSSYWPQPSPSTPATEETSSP